MIYNKFPLSFEQQAQLLIDRKLRVSDKQELVHFLSNVNYYRFSAYWFKYKYLDENGNECISPDIDFATLKRHYQFDRELRLLVLDPIEQIEIAILRTRMVEQFALKYDKYGYCDRHNFCENCSEYKFSRLQENITADIERSKEEFIKRFRYKYSESPHFPLWIAVEAMSLGTLLTFFRLLKYDERDSIARAFDVSGQILESWLLSIHYIRNVCAHYARLWNRAIQISPGIPRINNHPEWYSPVHITENSLFAVMSVLQYLISYINPTSDWSVRVDALFTKYLDIPKADMGFPPNWLKSPIWLTAE